MRQLRDQEGCLLSRDVCRPYNEAWYDDEWEERPCISEALTNGNEGRPRRRYNQIWAVTSHSNVMNSTSLKAENKSIIWRYVQKWLEICAQCWEIAEHSGRSSVMAACVKCGSCVTTTNSVRAERNNGEIAWARGESENSSEPSVITHSSWRRERNSQITYRV